MLKTRLILEEGVLA